MTQPVATEYRRALEALRNGVPNADAVRVLGCGQTNVEELFRAQLADVAQAVTEDRQTAGLLISGGFGTGKSHLLEYLEQLALGEEFVVSRVVISKETPLYDPGKMFRSAIQSAVVPHQSGSAIAEIAHRLRPDSGTYADFYRWVNAAESGVAPLFAASLFLHERLHNDPELVERITGFWAGDPIAVAQVRQGLRQAGGTVAFAVKAVPVKQLATQRFAFATRLILGAGYRGWVILIDEAELVGRYSLLQRGRSYAELARWLGKLEADPYPGLITVTAITDDFTRAVLEDKGDRDYIGPKLRSKDTEEYQIVAARAEAGMRAIEREAIELAPPGEAELSHTYDRLREVHSRAYGWDAPPLDSAAGATSRAMRSYVRRWINEWDLTRLYPGSVVSTEEVDLRPTYVEMDELEETSEPEPAIEPEEEAGADPLP